MSDVEKGYPAAAPAAAAARATTIANPATLGLFSFASTTLILSFYNTGVRGVVVPNVVVGMAMGVGGLAQLLAGMWEFATGNTFGATGVCPSLFFALPFFFLFSCCVGAPHPN